ncbi:hypothetical protein ACROYT_G022193 [Oculina patagonica]
MLAFLAVVLVILQFCLLEGISAGDLQVQMAIFSGRVDPQWSVISTDQKLVQIQNLLNTARKSALVYTSDDMPARLGYKGFLVENNKKWELIVGPKTVQLQLLLFQSMPKAPWMDAAVKTNNNCYNYANIRITNTFAQPGRGSGAVYAAMTANAVRTASVNDGLVVAANANFPARTRHVVALVVDPGVDFHWYLKNSDGK